MSKINLRFDLAEYVNMNYSHSAEYNSDRFLQMFADLVKLEANIELVNFELFCLDSPTKKVSQLDIVNAMNTPDLKAHVYTTLDLVKLEEKLRFFSGVLGMDVMDVYSKIIRSPLNINIEGLLTPTETELETAFGRFLCMMLYPIP